MNDKAFRHILGFAAGDIGLFLRRPADIEAPQTVIGTVKTGIKEAESIQHDLNEIQADLRSAAEGVAGPIKDAAKTVNDVKNEAQSNIQAVKDKADAAKNIASDPEGALNTMAASCPVL